MGITFEQLQKRLVGALDVIPAPAAGDFINDALREIYDSYDWGFLYTESYVRTPEIIEGNASTVKFQPKITVDASIQAKINEITENDVDLNTRQVRLVAPKIQDSTLLYNIVEYDNDTGEITLDQPFQDQTNVAARIQILKIYYTAPLYTPTNYDPAVDPVPDPIIDFRRFESVVSPRFRKRLILDQTLTDLDRVDPKRTRYLGETKTIVSAGIDASGNQLFEYYPISRQERLLKVKYLRNGAPLVRPRDLLPLAFSKELVLAKAKQLAREWVIDNAQKIPNIGNVNRLLTANALAESPNNSSSYKSLLAVAKKKDEELFPQSYLGDFYIYPYYDDTWSEYDYTLPHDRFGETLVIDAAAPTIEIDI